MWSHIHTYIYNREGERAKTREEERQMDKERDVGSLYRFIVCIGMRVRDVNGSKGNFQQTAGSIGSKLEKNIRFLIETTLPKISSTSSH